MALKKANHALIKDLGYVKLSWFDSYNKNDATSAINEFFELVKINKNIDTLIIDEDVTIGTQIRVSDVSNVIIQSVSKKIVDGSFMLLNNVQGIEFSNIYFKSNRNIDFVKVVGTNTNNIVIDNCILENTFATLDGVNNGFFFVNAGGDVDNIQITNNRFISTTVTSTNPVGVKIKGNTNKNSNIRIKNNDFTGFKGICFECHTNWEDVVVSENVFDNTKGYMDISMVCPNTTGRNGIVTNNMFSNISNKFCIIETAGTDNVIVSNNVFRNCSNTYIISSSGVTKDTTFINNNVQSDIKMQIRNATNYTIKNNIFIGSCEIQNQQTTNTIISDNIFNVVNNIVIYFNGTNTEITKNRFDVTNAPTLDSIIYFNGEFTIGKTLITDNRFLLVNEIKVYNYRLGATNQNALIYDNFYNDVKKGYSGTYISLDNEYNYKKSTFNEITITMIPTATDGQQIATFEFLIASAKNNNCYGGSLLVSFGNYSQKGSLPIIKDNTNLAFTCTVDTTGTNPIYKLTFSVKPIDARISMRSIGSVDKFTVAYN